jgi:hypothetical protein
MPSVHSECNSPWLTDASVIVDAIDTFPPVHTAAVRTVLIIGLTVDAGETQRTRARVRVDILVAGGTIVTWRRHTFINVYLAVLAIKAIHTQTRVITNPIKARSTVLTWN